MIELKPTTNPLLHHKNRTSKYLKPILGHYLHDDRQFEELQTKCHPIGFGVADFLYDDYNEKTIKEDIVKNNCLYIMVDLFGVYRFNTYPKKEFYKLNTLEFVKKYKDKGIIKEFYPYCGEETSNQWIMTIKIPHEFGNIMEKFLNGEYSKLYTNSQIDQYIKKFVIVQNQKALSETRQILTKDNNFKKVFEERLIKEFKLKPTFTVDDNVELDMPPKLEAECFNLEYVKMNNILI